ncbi:MAG TPA: hypothetical protein PK228_09360 [Saprospiraceae bacterium]|nr:hypothetical protein [Saprospiraceae bacterium]
MLSFIKTLFSPRIRPITPGAYYSIRYDETCYKVLKVLAVDEANGKPYGIHIRLYGRRFAQPPTKVGEPEDMDVVAKTPPGESLTIGAVLAAMNPTEMTMGHLPYTYDAFLRMEPKFIQAGTVEEAELEGYRIWKEDSGGYWN